MNKQIKDLTESELKVAIFDREEFVRMLTNEIQGLRQELIQKSQKVNSPTMKQELKEDKLVETIKP